MAKRTERERTEMSYSAYGAAHAAVDPFRPTLEMSFRGHRQSVCSVDFQSPSSSSSSLAPRVVSGGADGSVMMWDTRTTTRTLRFVGHRGPVLGVACSSRANLIVSGGHDGYVRLWIPNMRRTTAIHSLQPERANDGNSCGWRAHAGSVRALAFAQDGSDHLYTAGDDKTVKCWDLNYASSSQQIGAGPGNKFMGCFADPSVAAARNFVHTNWIRALAAQNAYTSASFFSYVASGGDDQTIRVWDTRTRAVVHTLFECAASVHALSFHPDGYVLASGDASGAINLFDLRHASSVSPGPPATAPRRSHSLLQHYSAAHKGGVEGLDFAANGGWLLSAGQDSTAKLWDVKEVYLYCTLQAHEGAVKACRFSEDGRWFATGGSEDKSVLLWRSGLAAASLVPCEADGRAPERRAAGWNSVAPPPTLVPPPACAARVEAAPSSSTTSSVGQRHPSYPMREGGWLQRTSGAASGGASQPDSTPCGTRSAGLIGRASLSVSSSPGLPPLSPSPKKNSGAARTEEVERMASAPTLGSGTGYRGGEAPRTEHSELDVSARERSFERCERRYTSLTTPEESGDGPRDPKLPRAVGKHSPETPQRVTAPARHTDAAASFEREQAMLVGQERAYQHVRQDRISSQRLDNLEEALASLAAYMQAQNDRHSKELAELRAMGNTQRTCYEADIADVKRLLTRLAERVEGT